MLPHIQSHPATSYYPSCCIRCLQIIVHTILHMLHTSHLHVITHAVNQTQDAHHYRCCVTGGSIRQRGMCNPGRDQGRRDANPLHPTRQHTPSLVTGGDQATQWICRRDRQLNLGSTRRQNQDLFCRWMPDHLAGHPAEPLLGMLLTSMEQPCQLGAMRRAGHPAEPHCQLRSALLSPPSFELVTTRTGTSLAHCTDRVTLVQCLVIQAATSLG